VCGYSDVVEDGNDPSFRFVCRRAALSVARSWLVGIVINENYAIGFASELKAATGTLKGCNALGNNWKV